MTDCNDPKNMAEIEQLKAEIEQLKAEIAQLKNQEIDLKTEIDSLRPDAERYRFIKLDEQMGLVEDLAYNIADVEWDAEIDAAIVKEACDG